jgi:hypothetical protein
MNLDQWRNRALAVTVKELCPCCNDLKEGVALRQTATLPMYSCKPCYDAEERNQAATSDEDYYAW